MSGKDNYRPGSREACYLNKKGYLKGGFQLAVYAGHGAEEAERKIHDAVADFIGYRKFLKTGLFL